MMKIIVPIELETAKTCDYGIYHCISSCAQCDNVEKCVIDKFWEELEFQTAGR